MLTDEQVLARLQVFVANNKPFKAAARRLGVSDQMLREVLRGTRQIGKKIPAAMGLTVTRLYQETACRKTKQ